VIDLSEKFLLLVEPPILISENPLTSELLKNICKIEKKIMDILKIKNVIPKDLNKIE
jgi:hypothetical protein